MLARANRAWVAAALLVALLSALPQAALVQQPAKVPKVGVLDSSRTQGTPNQEAFERTLQERGWVVGKTIAIEYRPAGTVEPEVHAANAPR